ncbi:hypothetical protein KCP76_05540 [Salmonella enterica subsp. enterica serovar Weltevreden]|nr:hypothetical protein KCP76_05540 [Salmonella enterica subsp. enterica serovar Weltevreden]
MRRAFCRLPVAARLPPDYMQPRIKYSVISSPSLRYSSMYPSRLFNIVDFFELIRRTASFNLCFQHSRQAMV